MYICVCNQWGDYTATGAAGGPGIYCAPEVSTPPYDPTVQIRLFPQTETALASTAPPRCP